MLIKREKDFVPSHKAGITSLRREYFWNHVIGGDLFLSGLLNFFNSFGKNLKVDKRCVTAIVVKLWGTSFFLFFFGSYHIF